MPMVQFDAVGIKFFLLVMVHICLISNLCTSFLLLIATIFEVYLSDVWYNYLQCRY